MRSYYITFALCISSVTIIGCRTPDVWLRQADEVADRTIAEFQEEAYGETRPFSVVRPSDTLRKRLIADQSLPSFSARRDADHFDGAPLMLDKEACLQVAARNSKAYQNQKEEVFRSALALDLERDAYRNSWGGLLSALFSSDQTGASAEDKISSSFTTELSRRFRTGGSIAGKLGIDVVRLLTLDESSSFGLLADATVTMPLLRGSRSEIVTEPLTQAERDVTYALWNFERFRESFTVQVASEYFAVLQTNDELQNAVDSVVRLERNLERAEQLSRAGRMPELQVDQTRQDLLRARTRLVTARQNSESRLDQFKRTIGLPVDAAIILDSDDLQRFSELVAEEVEDETLMLREQELVDSALDNRLDLRIVYERLLDAERKVNVARDALRMGLDFRGSTSNQMRRYSGSDTENIRFQEGRYSAGLNLDLPWHRTSERNAYRLQILAAERAQRDLEEREDQVKAEVRNALRSLIQSRQNYVIQRQALDVASTRVESTQMFIEAGRADTRDVLEAEEALVSARNAVTAALVSYRVSQLELLKDTGTLDINREWDLEI